MRLLYTIHSLRERVMRIGAGKKEIKNRNGIDPYIAEHTSETIMEQSLAMKNGNYAVIAMRNKYKDDVKLSSPSKIDFVKKRYKITNQILVSCNN